MQIFSMTMVPCKSHGSATVESAIVFPLILMLLLSTLTCGIELSNKVKLSADEDAKLSSKIISPDISAEDGLRLKWVTNVLAEYLEQS